MPCTLESHLGKHEQVWFVVDEEDPHVLLAVRAWWWVVGSLNQK